MSSKRTPSASYRWNAFSNSFLCALSKLILVSNRLGKRQKIPKSMLEMKKSNAKFILEPLLKFSRLSMGMLSGIL